MIYFSSMFKLTRNSYRLNFFSLFKVCLTDGVNKPGFMRPETRTQS